MKITTETPTEAGLYWFRQDEKTRWVPAWVHKLYDAWEVEFFGSDISDPIKYYQGQWSKIEEPQS